MQITLQIHKKAGWKQLKRNSAIRYVQHSRQEMEVLFTFLADRYERGSLRITSNLPFSKWEQIFKDPMTAAAAIDRLVHHSVILELNIASYRIEQAQKTKMIKSTEETMRPINDLNSTDQLSSCWGSDTHQTTKRAMCDICASGIIQSGSALWCQSGET